MVVVVAWFASVQPAVCRFRPHLFARPGVSLSDVSEAGTVAPRAASPATAKWRVQDSNGIASRIFTEPRLIEKSSTFCPVTGVCVQ